MSLRLIILLYAYFKSEVQLFTIRQIVANFRVIYLFAYVRLRSETGFLKYLKITHSRILIC